MAVSSTSLSFVGTVDFQYPLLFCNGVETTAQVALEHATKISQAFKNRKVFVFHNPTHLSQHIRPDETQLLARSQLAEQLAQEISGFIATHGGITVFAHSHGALLTKKALDKVSPLDRSKVTVHAFGGAFMLKKSLAAQVHNYVFDGDFIPQLGNSTDRKMVLGHRKQIEDTMREKKLDFPRAVATKAGEDLFRHLHPLSSLGSVESFDVSMDKRRRYQKIFVEKDSEAFIYDPFFQEQLGKYISCFRDYNIEILQGAAFQQPEFRPRQGSQNFGEFVGNLMPNLAAIAENILTALAATATHAMQHHNFEAYIPKIREIAREYSEP